MLTRMQKVVLWSTPQPEGSPHPSGHGVAAHSV
jgi:hypothetical protein